MACTARNTRIALFSTSSISASLTAVRSILALGAIVLGWPREPCFAWRSRFYHARLAEAITPYGSLHGMTVSEIAQLVQSQAAFMRDLDLFRLIFVLALLACPIILLLKSPPEMAK